MNDFAKGRLIHLATLPLGTDNLGLVLLQTTNLPSDNTLKRTQFLSGVLVSGTGAGVEAAFTNYGRIWLSAAAITVTVNSSTDVATLDVSDGVWNAAGGVANNSLGKLLVVYRPNSSSLDTAIPILTAHDFVASTTGGNLTAIIPSIATAV